MITLLLLAALQAQAPALEIEADVDRDRIAMGEEFTYTVRASSDATDPIEVILAPLAGFEIVSRSEATQVSTAPAAVTGRPQDPPRRRTRGDARRDDDAERGGAELDGAGPGGVGAGTGRRAHG